MFVGHYGVSFAAQRVNRPVPLWVLFIAVQLLDVSWAPFVLLGIEKVRIVPGITASNPLDLYYMPYTHSLVAAAVWSVAGYGLYRLWRPSGRGRAAMLVGFAIFSHWILDFIVHRPDLPLYDDAAKVGLGLWNRPALAFGLEAVSLRRHVAVLARASRAQSRDDDLRARHAGRSGDCLLRAASRVGLGRRDDGAAAYALFAAFVARWEARHPFTAHIVER
jgi:hypothetical protein